MKINYIIYFLVACIFLVNACKKETVPVKTIDYKKAEIELIDSMGRLLPGLWLMKKVDVKPFPSSTNEINIYKDTTLTDLAILTISYINSNTIPATVKNDVFGNIRFKNKTYPVGFTMGANYQRISQKGGGQVFALFEYRFPSGTSHITEPEENYLSNLTLIGNNYEMEVSKDGKSMVWKGLNRAIKEIRFEKM
ncbi:hypothetical protein GS399_19040 [Pedobacter sp. HMF7647]|uniref:DUF5004 domain-containing protein n=1 Tax=Hufsiella arboris TaxID=2695275 RepID=A0A7K1YFA4_9SPHI|nr:hypothetical protein [Hufsiella arboris]MXV53071.1 hypothetical protein [Hufsiella arboris]